jgi:F-box/leucine-rich repeat protein 2/20
VAESCPLLQHINLQGTLVTDATIVSLSKHCPLLTVVFLGSCSQLTDAAVLAVAEGLPGLTHLGSIEAITSSAVETLVAKCPRLKLIELSYCPNISDVTLMTILEQCPKLTVLYVNGCPDVTGIGVALVAKMCPKLTQVTVDDRPEILIESLQQIFPHVDWALY